MKIVRFVSYFSLITLFAFTCSKNEAEDDFSTDFEIKYGSECGWCAGQEYLIIKNSNIEYQKIIPCGENKGETKKSRKISEEEWNEITSSFSYDLFFTLDYKDCNVCVDGCDEILEIKDNDKEHILRFTPSKEIEGMEELRILLGALMEELKDE